MLFRNNYCNNYFFLLMEDELNGNVSFGGEDCQKFFVSRERLNLEMSEFGKFIIL